MSESFFLDIAKISISIAGFAGVVSGVRHPRDVAWKANEVNALKVILEHSIFGVVIGLLPSVLNLHYDERAVYRLLSIALAAIFFYEVVINWLRVSQSSKAKAPPRKYLLLSTFFGPTGALCILECFNAIKSQGPVLVAVGALWIVTAGCIQFVIAALHVKREDPPAAPLDPN